MDSINFRGLIPGFLQTDSSKRKHAIGGQDRPISYDAFVPADKDGKEKKFLNGTDSHLDTDQDSRYGD